MIYEVHIYMGTACITKRSQYKYPVGERHAFLFYLKEGENSEFNQIKAEKIIANLGLDEIEFSKAGKVSSDKIKTSQNKEYYDQAIESGSTLVLYTDPI